MSGVASDLLGYLLHLDRAELYLKIKQAADAHRGYLIVKRQLTPEEYDNLLNLKSRIDWVSLSNESQRHYPNGTLAAHVLGSVDFEEKGNAGIEKASTRNCAARPAHRLLTDVHRRGIAPQTTIPAKPGTSSRSPSMSACSSSPSAKSPPPWPPTTPPPAAWW
jgi:cell division protein FtsI/penicillin-binding protein 2